ncbi:MAG: RNA polymerase sigma factor [Clostridiales bacterium]|nr:RNA polymerase sigma factor [Clostridiales bacterium]
MDDSSKFEYLYSKYKNYLLYKSYQILGDYALAEDAVSEAYIRIYKNLRKINLDDAGRTIAFLAIIAKNESLTLLSKRKNVLFSELEEFNSADSYDLEGNALSDAVADDMMKVICTLKEELKQPFLLSYAYDMSHKEIASVLGITENNATVRIHRAKKKIAQLLKKGGLIDEKGNQGK